VGRKSLDLEQVLSGYSVLCVTPGSPPLFVTAKRSGKKESGSRAGVERVFCFVCKPRFPRLFVTAKEVGSKESGSRARVVRVFGFVCNRFPFFYHKN